jgi:hypothetical protein
VFSFKARRMLREVVARDRRRFRPSLKNGLGSIERLESRELMAYSPLGVSLPNLTVSGYAGPLAFWGGPIAVNLNVSNAGGNTQLQPLSLAPGAATTADAGPFYVSVFVVARPGTRHSATLFLGNASFPQGLQQNASVQQTANFNLPTIHPGFSSAYGSKVYLELVVNPNNQVNVGNPFQNTYLNLQNPIRITPPAAAVSVVGSDLPSVLQPGDTIAPNFELANFGAISTTVGGTLDVQLVASRSRFFNRGTTVIANYPVEVVQPQSNAPTQDFVPANVNLQQQSNFETIRGGPVTLPTSPRRYYIGFVVNPQTVVPALASLRRPQPLLISQVRTVGPPIPGLPPAGVIGQQITPFPNPFPYPNAPIPNG